MSKMADVIIIGGGIQGASLAFHLGQRGVKAAVLEQRFIAAEATGRSSGLVRMHYDLELESKAGLDLFSIFPRLGAARWRQLRLHTHRIPEDRRPKISKSSCGPTWTDAAAHIGIDTTLITAEEVARMAPYLVTDDFTIAAFEPDSGYADPSASTMALMNAARQKGASLVQDCQVTGILVDGGKVSGVKSSQGDFCRAGRGQRRRGVGGASRPNGRSGSSGAGLAARYHFHQAAGRTGNKPPDRDRRCADNVFPPRNRRTDPVRPRRWQPGRRFAG